MSKLYAVSLKYFVAAVSESEANDIVKNSMIHPDEPFKIETILDEKNTEEALSFFKTLVESKVDRTQINLVMRSFVTAKGVGLYGEDMVELLRAIREEYIERKDVEEDRKAGAQYELED